MPRRHPELARKMKANSTGERVLDEEAMMTARAILRKEKIEDRRKILFSFREMRRSPQRFSRLWAENICPVMKSEGAERERYANIYFGIVRGQDCCTDSETD